MFPDNRYDSRYAAAGTVYVDAGAIAVDAIYGNLTASVSAYGLKVVQAQAAAGQPTSAPLVIEYSVADGAGNRASVYRAVHLACASTRATCASETMPGHLYCSINAEICVEAVPDVSPLVLAPPVVTLNGRAQVRLFVSCLVPIAMSVGLRKGLAKRLFNWSLNLSSIIF